MSYAYFKYMLQMDPRIKEALNGYPDFIRQPMEQLFEPTEEATYLLRFSAKFLKWATFARFKYPDPGRVLSAVEYMKIDVFYVYTVDGIIEVGNDGKRRYSIQLLSHTFDAYNLTLIQDYFKAIQCNSVDSLSVTKNPDPFTVFTVRHLLTFNFIEHL